MHVEEESLSQSESASTSLDNGYTSVAPTLSVWPLSVLIFYVVAGGPYGVEESVKAGGNFYALLFYTIMPFVWSMQESLITAELSCAYPDASGGVVWVEEAFGKYAGWLNGSLSWVSGATDNAIYPVLFLDYLASLINLDDLHPGARFLLFSAFAVGMGYMTWRGLEIVGNVSIAIGILAMSPFLFLVIFSCNKLEPSRWLEMPSLTAEEFSNSSDYDLSGGFFPSAAIGGIMVRPFANNLFWNLNSFDSASAFAEEVGPYPEKVIPRALTLAWIMTVTGYLIPLLFAIGASKGLQEDWDDGYLTVIAQQVAGSWLAKWLVFSAGISNLALYQAELSSDVFQLHGMAHKGLLPSFLGVRSRHGTPTNAIILATIIVIIFCTARLDQLVEMLNFNYGVSLVLEYAAFIKLRITKPDGKVKPQYFTSATPSTSSLTPSTFTTSQQCRDPTASRLGRLAASFSYCRRCSPQPLSWQSLATLLCWWVSCLLGSAPLSS